MKAKELAKARGWSDGIPPWMSAAVAEKVGWPKDLDREVADAPPAPLADRALAAEKEPTKGEISVKGPIVDDLEGGWLRWLYGDEVEYTSARMVRTAIREAGRRKMTLSIRINSPGGYTSEMAEIVTALAEAKSQGAVIDTVAEGVAASAAASIFLVGRKREMGEYSTLMYHQAWVGMIVVGNADEVEKAAASAVGSLRAFDETLVSAIASKTKLDADEAQALIAAETWLNTAQAIEKGFATGEAFIEPEPEGGGDHEREPEQARSIRRGAAAFRAVVSLA